MNKFQKTNRKIISNLKRTYKNKIVSLVIIGLGIASAMIDTVTPAGVTHDGTALVFSLIFGTLLFFAKDNWVL